MQPAHLPLPPSVTHAQFASKPPIKFTYDSLHNLQTKESCEETFSSQMGELRGKIKRREKKIHELNAEVAVLTHQLNEEKLNIRKVTNELVSLKLENTRLKRYNDGLHFHLSDKLKMVEEIKQLKKEKEQLKIDNERLNRQQKKDTEISRLQNNQLCKLNEDFEKETAHTKFLQQQVDILTRSLDDRDTILKIYVSLYGPIMVSM